MAKNKLSIFDKIGSPSLTKQAEIDNTQADILALRNTLQAVAQMRKLQLEYFKTRDQRLIADAKRLEAAVDMRLASLGIKAV